MGYDAKIIALQLRVMQPAALTHLRDAWHDAPEISWLVDRERAFRARWPVEQDPSPLRSEELAALLDCWRTRTDYCELATGPDPTGCADCPYAAGDLAAVLPGWLPFGPATDLDKDFYDVRTRDGQQYLECWPNADNFHVTIEAGRNVWVRGGPVIKKADVTHCRRSWPAEPTPTPPTA